MQYVRRWRKPPKQSPPALPFPLPDIADCKHLCHYRLLLQLLLQFLCRHSHLLHHRHHLLRHRQQNLLLVAQEGKGSRSRDGHDRRQRKGDGSTSVDCDDGDRGDNNGNNGNSGNNGNNGNSGNNGNNGNSDNS